jgi:hypothetical protein
MSNVKAQTCLPADAKRITKFKFQNNAFTGTSV